MILVLLCFLGVATEINGQDTLHFVFLNTNPAREALTKEASATLQQRHLDNITRLYHKNKILAAGPFSNGGGFFIVNATDSTELDSLLQSDPAIRANRFVIETHPLNLLHGKLCKATEPFAMDTAVFIRVDRTEASTEANLTTLPLQFVSRSEALLIGSWKGAGGFVIGRSNHPAFAQWLNRLEHLNHGRSTLTRRTLWYGKGTFCE